VRGGAPQPGVSLVLWIGSRRRGPRSFDLFEERHGRFRDSDLLRRLFETVLRRCIDTAYGTAEMLKWLVNEHGIEPHIPVFDKSQHTDGTLSRDDFAYDHKRDCYICPAGKNSGSGKKLYRMPRPLVDRNGMIRYRASKLDCQAVHRNHGAVPNTPPERSRAPSMRAYFQHTLSSAAKRAVAPDVADAHVPAGLVIGDVRRSPALR